MVFSTLQVYCFPALSPTSVKTRVELLLLAFELTRLLAWILNVHTCTLYLLQDCFPAVTSSLAAGRCQQNALLFIAIAIRKKA